MVIITSYVHRPSSFSYYVHSHIYIQRNLLSKLTAPTSTDYSLTNPITNSRCVMLNHQLIMSISISMVSLIYLR